MRLLITGGLGFIGSNFVRYILSKDSSLKVLIVDNFTYAADLETYEEFNKLDNITIEKININNGEKLDRIFQNFIPDAVVNFAAESHVDNSIKNPNEFIHTNINGTFTLLNIFKNHCNKSDCKFIHVSTDEVFGSLTHSEEPFTEESNYRPNSPYSASKASSDHLVRAYIKTYKINAITTHCSNNYGPYQNNEKLIPLCITKALNKQDIPIYGNGCQVRDWIYVTDHCDALYTLLINNNNNSTYNIGGNAEMKNIDVVSSICKILDQLVPLKDLKSYLDFITYVDDRPGHDIRYAINSSRINLEYGWVPRNDFKTGIEKTIKWYVDKIIK